MTADEGLTTVEDVLRAAEARWQRHVEVLDWQPDYRIRGPEDPFTPAQEYLHHAHWLEYAAEHIRARLEGRERPPRIEDVDTQNDAWAAEDAGVPHEQAKGRAEIAWRAYLDLVRRTDDGDRYARNVTGHFDQHFGYMLEGMFTHESAGWERLTGVLDATPEGRLHLGDGGVEWESRDVYAHLERWMAVQFPRVEAYLETGEVPELEAPTDELNARWTPEDRALSFEEARRRAFLTRDRFVRRMREVPVAKWNARLVSLCAGNSAGHYAEHLEWIEGAS